MRHNRPNKRRAQQFDQSQGNVEQNKVVDIDWNLLPSSNSQALQHEFESQKRTLVLVDGYNMIFQDWFYPTKCAKTLNQDDICERRNIAVSLVSALCSHFSNCFGRIYFDSSQYQRIVYDSRVDIVYSGGSGPNRADMAILGDITAHKRFPIYDTLILVTDDWSLSSEGFSLGARLLGVVEFCTLLKRKVA